MYNKDKVIFRNEVLEMLEAVILDAKTMLIKTDTEQDMAEIIDFINLKDKKNAVDRLFALGRENNVIDQDYVFNRDDLYER